MQLQFIPVNNWKRDGQVGFGICIRHGRGEWHNRWVFWHRCKPFSLGLVGW